MITFRKTTSKPRSISALLATVVLATLGSGSAIQAASVRFLPMNQEIAERKIGIKDSKMVTELKDLNAKKRSRAYTCVVGETQLSLVALDRERPNGNPAGVDIILAKGMKSPLVLIFPDAENASGIRAVAVDDSDAGFPWGSLRFVNATDKPLMVRYEKETRAVPGSYAVADVVPGGEARNMGVQLFSEAEPNAVLYSAVWEHDPNLRKLIFIIPSADPTKKTITLAIIPQDKRASK